MSGTPASSKRSLPRALWRARLRSATLLAPSGMTVTREQKEAGSTPEELPPPASQVRTEADTLWSQGNRQAAIELLRNRAHQRGGESLWWPLFFKLQAEGRYDAASLALRATMDSQPANLGALELLLDDVWQRGPDGVVPGTLDRLAMALPSSPDKHTLALLLVMPLGHEPTLSVLRGSSSADVRHAMQIFDSRPEEDPEPAPDGSDAWPVALWALSVDRHHAARQALSLVPDSELKTAALRITVRRLLRAKQSLAAHRYLTVLDEMLPEDRWVQEKLLQTGEGLLTPYQLAKRGYPFPARVRKPVHEPRPSTVLYLLHNSLPYDSAGYATRTHGLLTGISRLGWNIHGVTRLGYPFDMPKHRELAEAPQVDWVDGIPYHRLSTTNSLELKKPLQFYVDRYTRALHPLVGEQRPFLLHAASNHWNGLAAVKAARELGIRSVYEVRGLWEVTRASRDPEWAKGGMYNFMARMEAEAACHANHVIAITQALKDELVARGVDPEKITLVPNGVDAERFTPKPRNEALAAQLGVSGRPVIGYIGSVLDYEGLGLLIKATTGLAAEGRRFVVLIVGDGAELERFRAEVEEEELEEYVIFTGRVPHEQVEDYYSLVDIAPFPRLPLPVCEMVSPLKPFEAMAMQKAVVASDVAALAEIVQDGVTGLLHRKGDAEDLQRVLAKLLDDPVLRERLAQAGRTWVRQERRWSDLAGHISQIYTDLGGVADRAPLN